MKKAQSSLEFIITVTVIIAALLCMQVYLKRALQGSYRSSADQLGERYDPKNTTSDTNTWIDSSEISSISIDREPIEVGGRLKTKLKSTTTFNSEEFTTVRGWEQIGP
ncbi:MAG: hypothetical protein NC916_03280 [Candidatus Omnitrophica bacterium]|nr:hypothetical protein [Candidatus Omnitrophota bacterium]